MGCQQSSTSSGDTNRDSGQVDAGLSADATRSEADATADNDASTTLADMALVDPCGQERITDYLASSGDAATPGRQGGILVLLSQGSRGWLGRRLTYA